MPEEKDRNTERTEPVEKNLSPAAASDEGAGDSSVETPRDTDAAEIADQPVEAASPAVPVTTPATPSTNTPSITQADEPEAGAEPQPETSTPAESPVAAAGDASTATATVPKPEKPADSEPSRAFNEAAPSGTGDDMSDELRKKVRSLLGITDFTDPNIELALRRTRNIAGDGTKIVLDLANGHSVECNFAKPGAEIISLCERDKDKFDAADAQAMVTIAKHRGWKNIHVHGSSEQQAMLWLEAQKQGLNVADYTPPPQAKAAWDQHLSELKSKFGALPQAACGDEAKKSATPAISEPAPASAPVAPADGEGESQRRPAVKPLAMS